MEDTVRGRVQGVSYRASFQRAAVSRDLTGWVRNQPDGTVAFLIQGSPDAVREMLGWAAKGPRLARVDGVNTSAVDLQTGLTTFDIHY
ncbi:MAG: acylphosphatase [Pseudomonadales bacterium]